MANRKTGPEDVEVRFHRNYKVVDGCWLWTGHLNNKGYGKFSEDWRIKVYAHRWAYQRFVGPIPDGLQIDHLCRNRACVNPAHLEAVTPRVNQRRSPLCRAHKTHCVNGHPFDEVNTYVRSDGSRQCRTCRRASYLRHIDAKNHPPITGTVMETQPRTTQPERTSP